MPIAVPRGAAFLIRHPACPRRLTNGGGLFSCLRT
jgi:hypothetical protein